ncbi:Na(+)/H(+) exchange regulatory cofactor NHE-RF1 isoform X2 [Erpetoichthys calabaricus]|uniref:Na(+)/H(+) exchange regulatory cofactor NHE-RF n=1 Tax=Erpetoichthys calabaricus TaxID=27687 RepID=A0A8C4TQL3_ERPCA|nr:Na(+)/H(+) exchange regulatory cofactor NHE-RF1 isoform X2 [Erpetoichthys calabaricus]
MANSADPTRPRVCRLQKGADGYGFHLHGEKNKTGQFIRLVEPDSPAELSGLRAGDRLVSVNGENVESESHQQVVARIRAQAAELQLLVVDRDTDELLQKRGLKCLEEYAVSGIPEPDRLPAAADDDQAEEDPAVVLKNGEETPEAESPTNSGTDKDSTEEHRPRLCHIRKGSTGYGFNLHSEKSKPGQFIRAVDADSPAEKSGLRPQDRIIAVNGMSVEGKQHSDVVTAIKAGGSETSLLVVDPDTDDFFKRCKVTPTETHLAGPLPEPAVNGEAEEKVNGKEAKEDESKKSVSPTPSNASSNTSLTTETPANEEPTESVPVDESLMTLNISLQQAKERAHQKRSSKRAPPMDWSKKNELFSNL